MMLSIANRPLAGRVATPRSSRTMSLSLRAQDPRVTSGREVRDDGKKPEKPQAMYADENPDDGFFKREKMSKAQSDKLRKEYLSFGGSSDTAMGSNYFLWIILIVAGLAILSAALGYI